MLFDDPMVGQSRYGEYYLYAVKNGTDTEYSFFAPPEVNEQIKTLRKGDRFEITKLAEQKGSKIITKYDVKLLGGAQQNTTPTHPAQSKITTIEVMLSSYQDALEDSGAA